MRKKFFKYLKFIFCAMLIVSIIAPSYATSVNGDAFITTEEFDMAISNFNKRLVTFEAGINSKIDMQVTSYLDRNGIWSGKDEPMIAPFAINTPITFMDKGNITNNWVKFNATESASLTGLNASQWYHYDEKLWTNISKRGLMRVSFSVKNTSNWGMNRAGIRIKNTQAYEKQYIIGFAITALPSTETVDMKNNVKFLHILSLNSMSNDYQSDHKYIQMPNITQQAFFFVDKGYDVWFSTCWELVSTNTVSGSVSMSNLDSHGTGSLDGSGDEVLTITEAKIY